MAEVLSAIALTPLNFNFLRFWRILSGNLDSLKSLKEWNPPGLLWPFLEMKLTSNLCSKMILHVNDCPKISG